MSNITEKHLDKIMIDNNVIICYPNNMLFYKSKK